MKVQNQHPQPQPQPIAIQNAKWPIQLSYTRILPESLKTTSGKKSIYFWLWPHLSHRISTSSSTKNRENPQQVRARHGARDIWINHHGETAGKIEIARRETCDFQWRGIKKKILSGCVCPKCMCMCSSHGRYKYNKVCADRWLIEGVRKFCCQDEALVSRQAGVTLRSSGDQEGIVCIVSIFK